MTLKEFGKLKVGGSVVCVSKLLYGENRYGSEHKDLTINKKYKIQNKDNKNQKLVIFDDGKMEWSYNYRNFEEAVRYFRKKKLLKLDENKSKYN